MSENNTLCDLFEETPFPLEVTKQPRLTDEEKIEQIASSFRDILITLGLDLDKPSIARTPQRIAEMYVKEVFSGLSPKNFPKMTVMKNDLNHGPNTHFVFVKSSFVSFCEHHFVPFSGTAYIAYKPHDCLIGLSKIPRIVRYYAKRPQLQERLTSQIATSLGKVLNTEDIAVSIEATHYCVLARGVEDADSCMVSNVLHGVFQSDPSLRKEFFDAINR